MARWLLRFGYDGRPFAGWARQPGARTVEGEISRGIERYRLASGPDGVQLSVASRTDRGVSARANALVVRSGLPGPSLLRALNGISPEICFTNATAVPEDFRVRTCRSRTYRYFDAVAVRSRRARSDAVHLFRGRIDVRSFGRGVPLVAPIWRDIDSLRTLPVGGGSILEIRAPSFVWGMVRKIVAAIREVDTGRLSLTDLRAALQGRARLTLPLAEPEPLVLWEVDHGVRWEFEWPGPNRQQSRYWADRATDLWVGRQLVASLVAPPVRRGPSGARKAGSNRSAPDEASSSRPSRRRSSEGP